MPSHRPPASTSTRPMSPRRRAREPAPGTPATQAAAIGASSRRAVAGRSTARVGGVVDGIGRRVSGLGFRRVGFHPLLSIRLRASQRATALLPTLRAAPIGVKKTQETRAAQMRGSPGEESASPNCRRRRGGFILHCMFYIFHFFPSATGCFARPAPCAILFFHAFSMRLSSSFCAPRVKIAISSRGNLGVRSM